MSSFSFTLSLSLFDSLSTSQQIIIFVLLLTTLQPIRNSIAYLAGLSSAYVVCGIGGYLLLDRLNAFIHTYISSGNMSNDSYYQIELISGIVMTLVGIWYYRKKRHAPPSRSQNIIIARLKSITGLTAFCIGAFISATSFPFSIPYIIALEKYTTLQLNFSAVVGSILLYNIGYALPMLVLFVLYLYVRKGKDKLSDTLPEKTRVLNVHLTTWVLVGVGIFSITDAGCYYTIGHALVKGRYF